MRFELIKIIKTETSRFGIRGASYYHRQHVFECDRGGMKTNAVITEIEICEAIYGILFRKKESSWKWRRAA